MGELSQRLTPEDFAAVAVQLARTIWRIVAFAWIHLQTLFVVYVFFHIWSQTRTLKIEDKGNGARFCIELEAKR